jgi:two-component system, OmpR family, sensor kinase
MKSLRARLLLGLLAGVLVTQVAIYLLIYARIEDEIDDLFDAELERSALSANANGNQSVTPLPVRKVENPQQEMIVSTYVDGEGLSSDRLDLLAGIERDIPAGFSKRLIDGRLWRLFSVHGGNKRVVAAQPSDIRNIAARQITLRAIAPSLAVLPFAAMMIWIAIFYGLKPLARITQALRGRSHRDLSPIDLGGLSPDLVPVGLALNELMQRVSKTIDTQRTFIADAAHELLTPLTALKLQAQMLARAKTADREREAMAELQGGISRTLQLAQDLLTLARHDSEADLHYTEIFSLSVPVRKALSIQVALAEEKLLKLETGQFDDVAVRGNAEAVSILSSTLIDNAVKYTDRGGTIRIGVHAGSRAELRIEDSGPGIPVEDRDRVFDRFYRRRDALGSGSGLGLAIAKEIATRCSSTIVLDSSEELGGLKVSVFFAPAVELTTSGKPDGDFPGEPQRVDTDPRVPTNRESAVCTPYGV